MKILKNKYSIRILMLLLITTFSILAITEVYSQSHIFTSQVGNSNEVWLSSNSIVVSKYNPNNLFTGHQNDFCDYHGCVQNVKYYFSSNRGVNWVQVIGEQNSLNENSVTDFYGSFFGANMKSDYQNIKIENYPSTYDVNLLPVGSYNSALKKPTLFSDGYSLYCSFYDENKVYVYKTDLQMSPCWDNSGRINEDGMGFNWTKIFERSTSNDDDEEVLISRRHAIRGIAGNNCKIHLVWNDNDGNLHYSNNESNAFVDEVIGDGNGTNHLDFDNTATITINKNTGTVYIGYTDEGHKAVCNFRYYNEPYEQWEWFGPQRIEPGSSSNSGEQWYTWVSSSYSGSYSIIAFTYYDLTSSNCKLNIAYSRGEELNFAITNIFEESIGTDYADIFNQTNQLGTDINADNTNSKFELYAAYTTYIEDGAHDPRFAWVTKFEVPYSSNEDDRIQNKALGNIGNYPNPFNPTTTIKYSLPKEGFVTLKVYDISGREIQTLVNEVKKAGNYAVDFNGSALSSGVYFYRIQSGDFVSVRRMLLVK